MVSLITNQPALAGELCDEIRLFLDVRKIEYMDVIPSAGYAILHQLEEGDFFVNRCTLYLDAKEVGRYEDSRSASDAGDSLAYKKIRKRGAKICVFRCLSNYFQVSKPWGSLTGVRPTKLLRELIKEAGEDVAMRMLVETFDVSREKAGLARQVLETQGQLPAIERDREIDLYLGIPFCVSRCAYCSFASALTSQDGALERTYVDALLREISLLKDVMEKYRVRSAYLGGGTPTALAPAQLERVAGAVAELIEPSVEFTAEAGRPDTITAEKLAILKQAGVNRISINPQTTCDATLSRIGRSHTAQEFFAAARLAKEFDFAVTNMDLIVGLPGEDEKIFEQSLRDVLALSPENVTIHTLAIKRASKFGMENQKRFAAPEQAERMLLLSRELLSAGGWQPYYMYRQKYMTGSMENTGYARPGTVCAYNVDNMEELLSILAFGAGAISKRVFGGQNRIERAACVKDIPTYLERVEEMALRKRVLMGVDD